jgi:LuxR family transcriptional regulator, maltose regulon positive regulatory protein
MVSSPVTSEFHDSSVLLARLAPPQQPARLLRRVRVEKLLAEALEYPLSLVVAPPGSGKTTALAQFALYGGWPVAWCRLSADDDGASLVQHLAAAFRQIAALNEAAVAERSATNRAPYAALDLLVNELSTRLSDETLLVLDGFETIAERSELCSLLERFYALLPLRLHLLIVSRVEPQLSELEIARLRGDLFALGQAELAFADDEAVALFELNGQQRPADLSALVTACRGWPIALRLAFGSEWRIALGLEEHSNQAPGSPRLDTYLQREVLDPLPEPLLELLLHSGLLRQLEPAAAAAISGRADAAQLIEQARQRQLFIEEASGGLAFQPLFHAFLKRMARQRLPNCANLHRRAAEWYRSVGNHEEALYHLLAAGDSEAAAAALSRYANDWLASGRAADVLAWIDYLPASERNHPRLLELRATTLHSLGRFDAALQAFNQAEVGYKAAGMFDGQVRALRGSAQIYLDIMQPLQAVAPLKRALKLLPTERTSERAGLLRLQAENWANRGRADVALILERAAYRMEGKGAAGQPGATSAPQPPTLPPRVLLRAGRLHEARQQLEAVLWNEGGEARLGLAAHREPVLLLSLIYTMLGSGTRGLALARRGLLEAQQAGGALTEAIAAMRLAHAYQLVSPGDISVAQHGYNEALTILQHSGVGRLRAEAYMGLTLLHGHDGNLATAERYASEGIQIAQAAGDEWLVGRILLGLGGAGVAVGDEQALEWLAQAQQRFLRGGDSYGEALVLLWQALHQIRNDQQEAGPTVARVIELVLKHGYESILTSATFFGPRDLAMLVPLLLRGRSLPEHSARASQLLRSGFPTIAADDAVEEYHPGYTLRVQMLGSFRVWRGWSEIQAREWQREKARQLFQLLLTYRGQWLQREQICAWLWPDNDLEAAERQFKVTLNALNTALEPGRPARTTPFFIRRQGLAYSFAPSYGVWIDVDEFELRVAGATAAGEPDFARRNSEAAMQLYKGDYLAEALYDPWTTEERERVLARYLAMATTSAAQLVERRDYSDAIQLCERVLHRDRCYEEAYQVLMLAHARSGSRSQALRTYTRCVQALHDDLGIEPLPETTALYERIKRNEG